MRLSVVVAFVIYFFVFALLLQCCSVPAELGCDQPLCGFCVCEFLEQRYWHQFEQLQDAYNSNDNWTRLDGVCG